MKSRFKSHSSFIVFSFVVAMILTLPIIGFTYGFVVAQGTDTGLVGIAERMFIGIVMATLATFCFGYVPDDGSGTSFTDLRFYIIPVFLFLGILIYCTSRLLCRFFDNKASKS